MLAVSLADPSEGGWLGNWAPGIGDPTFAGWFTVFAYAACAALCGLNYRKLKRRRNRQETREGWFWLGLSLLFTFLAINKQLDLQTAMTEGFRMLARKQGWYEQRHEYQRAFIEVFGVLTIAASLFVLKWTWSMPRALKVSAVGLCAVFGYVLIRATSFHYVDPYLGTKLFYVRVNALCELSGIFVAMAGALHRYRALQPARAARKRVR
jgi:hypothetical protein